jgi:FKBP-type peptidyl-prolyl cis-trans isomerase FkpA
VWDEPAEGRICMAPRSRYSRCLAKSGIPLPSGGFLTQFVYVPINVFNLHPMRTFLPLATCVFLAACLTEPKRCDSHPTDPATETFAPSLGIDLSTFQKTSLGDYELDNVLGTGETLASLAVVQIHYTAYLVNGTLIDQVMDQPFPIDLSTRATLGLADGMLGMSVGGQRTIIVPSENALGACPNGPIPGNSTLIYKVELLSIE